MKAAPPEKGPLPQRSLTQRERRAGVEFVLPYRTATLSTTGQSCTSDCAHCGGYYLKNMLPLQHAFQIKKEARSFLISGGCDKKGKIPHLEKKNELRALSQRGTLNMHSGLVTEKEAEELGTLAEVISFDLVLDPDIIQEVYGFEATPQDYLLSYRALKKHVRVVPHLCLGLKAGVMEKEYETLDILRDEDPEAVCFLVFTPTPATSFARCEPPSLTGLCRFLEQARRWLPSASLHLGCMRPGGRYRAELDSFAIQAGIDKIVQPAPAARKLAWEMGLKIRWNEECCCL